MIYTFPEYIRDILARAPDGIDIEAGGGLFISQIPPGVRDEVPYLWSEVFIGPHNGTLFIINATSLEVIKVIRDISARAHLRC